MIAKIKKGETILKGQPVLLENGIIRGFRRDDIFKDVKRLAGERSYNRKYIIIHNIENIAFYKVM